MKHFSTINHMLNVQQKPFYIISGWKYAGRLMQHFKCEKKVRSC